MKNRRKKIGGEDNQDRWLLTYADLITLLLAFFIVMYSMSQVDAKRFGKVSEALSGILKGNSSNVNKLSSESSIGGGGFLKTANLITIKSQFDDRYQIGKSVSKISSELTKRGLVVHIVESALFDEGSAVLKPEAVHTLNFVYERLKNIPNHIRVEGHTDNKQISSPIYPSNWELSAARSASVVKYFINNYSMSPHKLSALGYGEYRPIKPNNSAVNRAQNRRVDIVILTMELSLKEPNSNNYQFAAQR